MFLIENLNPKSKLRSTGVAPDSLFQILLYKLKNNLIRYIKV